MDADVLCSVQEDLQAISEFLSTLRYVCGNVSMKDEKKIYGALENALGGPNCKELVRAQREAVFAVFYDHTIYPRRGDRATRIGAILKGSSDAV